MGGGAAGIFFGLIGLGGLVMGYFTSRRVRTLAKTPGVGCAQVPSMATPDGAPCKVMGVAVPGRAPLVAPWSGQPCLWFRIKTVRYQVVTDPNGQQRQVENVLEAQASAEPFGVRDATGTVWVSPDGAEMTSMVASFRGSDRPRGADARWAESMRDAHGEFQSGHRISGAAKMTAGAFSGPLGPARDLSYIEEIVPEGRPLWVRGGARRDGQGNVWIGRPDHGAFVISSRDEEKGESDSKLVGTLFMVGGAIVLAIGLLVFVASRLT